MSITERQKAALVNHSPKARNLHLPDPTWKAKQAYMRATRRGSKKHASMEEKLKLLDDAEKVFGQPAAAKPPTTGAGACPYCIPVGSAVFASNVEWVAHVRATHPTQAALLDARALASPQPKVTRP